MSKRSQRQNSGSEGAVAETAVSDRETVTESKSEQRRKAIMTGKVRMKATVNTTLPDGTFVPQGGTVEVSQEYADRVKAEKNPSLIII